MKMHQCLVSGWPSGLTSDRFIAMSLFQRSSRPRWAAVTSSTALKQLLRSRWWSMLAHRIVA
jgi:hypothetical protein